jgi:1-acyl-sn-glycerol-3-phosphate acyltransferase
MRLPDDLVWRTSKLWMGPVVKLATRARDYGRERVPRRGGCVVAINHLHWIDVPLVGALCPRPIDYVAKIEAMRLPGLGQFIRAHGTIAVRRGESDREAVRQMRASARNGRIVGLFVEGTRQRAGRPGKAQPGAAMVAIQEGVPVVPVGVYGTQFWRIGNFAPCSVAWGHPIDFSSLPKSGRSYREATVEIEHSIHRLFAWLEEIHGKGRPKNVTPP